MAVEIERKFLVRNPPIEQWGAGKKIAQGYLSKGKGITVRVRIKGDQGFITVKGKTTGFSRAEYEYEIPYSDAEELLKLCDGGVIIKTRWLVNWADHLWEVDVFEGENQGLIVAEIELTAENEVFERPTWLGEEVSSDPRYFNSSLANHPWSKWP